MKLRRLPSVVLLAFAACATKAPSGAVTPSPATPAAPVDAALYPNSVAEKVKPRALPNQADIGRVINVNRAEIKKCYQDALLEDHGLTRGKITVKIAIDTSGQVKKVAIQGPPEFQSLEPCLKDRIELWTFPEASEDYGTEFVYLFQASDLQPPLVAPPAAAAQPAKAPAPSDPSKSPIADVTLDPAMVAAYVRSRLPNVKACFDAALQVDRTLAGRMTMHWTIDVNGDTRDVTVVSSSMPDSGVAECIQALIRGWRFPKPGGRSVEVSFPFVFQTHN